MTADDDRDHGADASDAAISDLEDDHDTMHGHDSSVASNGAVKKKYDPKDPSRPRRKKARRACYACQRAHLTCGDERPCQRCIKRGLGDACQDGVRKKAKYLHDAPPEALRPVLGPNYNPNANGNNGTPSSTRQTQRPQQQDTPQSDTVSNDFYSQGNLSAFTTSMYPAQSGAQSTTDGMSFASSQPPSTVSPNFQTPGSAPDTSTPQVDGLLAANPQMDLNALFDPSNPALYNFDLEGLNFGSQYAGWEFGILNKMGLGAETPPRENSISQSTPTDYTGVFGNNNNNGGGAQQGFDGTGTMMAPFSTGMDKTQTMYTQGNLQHGLPHAYAIAAGPTSLASPSTDATASPQNMTGMSPGNNGFGAGSKPTTPRVKPKQLKPNQMPQSSILGKRPARDTASVYDNVKEPYPYTAGFHNMVQVLRKRLPLNKLLRIAMTLAEIRPSFISSTKDLTREDLVFMEKCFQRTLIEFDDFLQHCCAPTIVCRRSGEVAAVNKEFTALTGWTKKVLLGKETNRHAAHARLPSNGSSKSDSKADDKTAAAGGGAGGSKDAWPQPVFLAELMDDDSIVEFYKDFSQLAFEDSRGRVQRSCRLIQYRPEEGDTEAGRKKAQERQQKGMLSNRVTTIDGEHGISRIEQDGKVACTYCWTIKRDVFDIPMMIIINFLPRYYPNQEPSQLMV